MKDRIDGVVLSYVVPPLALGVVLYGYVLLIGWSLIQYSKQGRATRTAK